MVRGLDPVPRSGRHTVGMPRSVLRVAALAAATALLFGCRDRSDRPGAPAAPAASAATLIDLGGSLEAMRAEFNAHKQESRFLTLLAPT